MTDLVARLREAIDETEVHPLHHLTCQMIKVPPEGFPFPTFSCNCNGPTERLRRCAADRKILDLHAPIWELVEWPNAADHRGKNWVCPSCRPAHPTTDWHPLPNEAGVLPEGFVPRYTLAPCPTLAALAEAYGVEA